MTERTVGVFGGSFNPPHVSHVLACLYTLSVYPLDRILVIPSYLHPFEKTLVPFEDRYEMTRLAFRHLEPWVEVSRVEEELGGVSYTIETLTELQRRQPDTRFRLMIGSDILGEVEKWRRFSEVKALAPLLVVPRMVDTNHASGGKTDAGFHLPAVSSTEVRLSFAAGEEPVALVPLAVREYIRARNLYRE